LLDQPVVLLHYVIQVFTLAQPAAATQGAFGLELLDRGRIRRVLVDIDDPRLRIRRVIQRLTKKRLAAAASRLAISRKSIV
jgi:hypothetical protein